MSKTRLLQFIFVAAVLSGLTATVTFAVDDNRIEVGIDQNLTIVPGSSETRAMLGMVRHPDGTIYLNTQRQGLYKSIDNGQTWAASPVNFDPSVPTGQRLHGLGVSSTGRLYLLHQRNGSELFISTSTDGGTAWSTTQIDYANLNPSDPYDNSDNDYNSFVELPDGTMMTAIELRYPEVQDYLGSPTKCGFHETVIRSTDNGATWGTPTSMHQHVAETSMAMDPNDPSHILAFTRIQRGLLPGEDQATVMALTGCPNPDWTDTAAYKNGILLESNDSGNTFHEATGALGGYYEHRGTALWDSNDNVVIAHNGGLNDYTVQARISLDGGDTWVDGSAAGTSSYNQSQKFELVPSPPDHSFMTPTVEISDNHYLTAYAHNDESGDLAISGVFWHIEDSSSGLVFYEGFDYEAGNIDGKGGWSNSGNTVGVSAESLSYGDLAVSGGSAKWTGYYGETEAGKAHKLIGSEVADLFKSEDSTFYVSMLIGDTAEPSDNSPRAVMQLFRDDGAGGFVDDGIEVSTLGDPGDMVRRVYDIGDGEGNVANLAGIAGTKLVVVRLTMKAGDDEMASIVNPDLATLVDSDFDTADTAYGELSAAVDENIDYLKVFFGTWWDSTEGQYSMLDEIRIGTTLSSVTPLVPETSSVALMALIVLPGLLGRCQRRGRRAYGKTMNPRL